MCWWWQFPLNKAQYDLLSSWSIAPFTWEQSKKHPCNLSRKSNQYQLDPSQMLLLEQPRPHVSVPLSKVYRRNWRVTVGTFRAFPDHLERSKFKATLRRRVDAAVPQKNPNFLKHRRYADKKRQGDRLALNKHGALEKLRHRCIGNVGPRHSHARKHGTIYCERCEEETRITKVRHKRGVAHSTRCMAGKKRNAEAQRENFSLKYSFPFEKLWPNDPMDSQPEPTTIIVYQGAPLPGREWHPIRQPRNPWPCLSYLIENYKRQNHHDHRHGQQPYTYQPAPPRKTNKKNKNKGHPLWSTNNRTDSPNSRGQQPTYVLKYPPKRKDKVNKNWNPNPTRIPGQGGWQPPKQGRGQKGRGGNGNGNGNGGGSQGPWNNNSRR